MNDGVYVVIQMRELGKDILSEPFQDLTQAEDLFTFLERVDPGKAGIYHVRNDEPLRFIKGTRYVINREKSKRRIREAT
jgi:hypothetical protein